MMVRNLLWGAAIGALVSGCSSSSGLFDTGLGDRFSQLFGSNSQAATTTVTGGPEDAGEQYCPDVALRDGAATLTSNAGATATGLGDVRYQGTITRTARECVLSEGLIKVKVGIQGRIIVGPAGAPPTVEVPLRVAVVQEGAPPKTIFSKFYRAAVNVGENNTPFSFVAEDVSYPAPSPMAGGSYVFYVGFDPAGLSAPAARPKAAAKKR